MDPKPNPEEPQSGSPDMINIAKNVLGDTEKLVQYLTREGIQLPSFSLDSVNRPDTAEYLGLQARLVSNLEALQYLIQGPKKTMRTMLCLGEDLAALQVAFQFNFFNQVPRDEAIDIANLALNIGIDEDRLARCMRMLVTHRIFAENVAGWFSHTPSSVIFHEDEELICTGQYM
jgi:hypothetical protein